MKLKAVVFICGAVLMSMEILGSRILAPYYGNSLFAWGSLIGIVLGALAIGYYFGGRYADKNASIKGLSLIVLVAGLSVALIPILSPLVFDPLIVASMGMKYGPLFSVLILFTIPSLFLGMVSPYAVKIEVTSLSSIGDTAGRLYAISTLGSLTGTFATSFFLIPAIGVRTILYSLSVLLIISALILSGRRIEIHLISSTIVLGGLAFIVFLSAPAESGSRTIFYKDSEYYEIKIKDLENGSGRIMYLDGALNSAMYLNSSKAFFTYTDYFHLPFLFNPGIKSVLFIGGGGGTGAKSFYNLYPEAQIDVVDIDPAVNTAARDFFNLKENDRIRIYTGEGRGFLESSAGKYDLIIIDAFNSLNSVPYHLMTQEFISMIKEHLTDGGMVVLNVHSAVIGEKSILLKVEYSTYKSVFPQIYVFPVGTNSSQVQNIIMIASASDSRKTRQELVEAAEKLSKKTGIMQLKEYANNLYTEEIIYNGPVLTDDYAPVDNLLLTIVDR
jgi:spermidine synthase